MAEKQCNLLKNGGDDGEWEPVPVTVSVSQPQVACYKNETLKLAIVYINTMAITGTSFTIDISNAPARSIESTEYFSSLRYGGYSVIRSGNSNTTINVGETTAYDTGQLVYVLA